MGSQHNVVLSFKDRIYMHTQDKDEMTVGIFSAPLLVSHALVLLSRIFIPILQSASTL